MKISVVIATHNRIRDLRCCLTAVTHQTHPAYEIIVIDDASTDGTAQMVAQEFPQVQYLHLPANSGPATARNHGIRHAAGSLIAFTDDDCVPPPDWLAQHARYYTNPTIGNHKIGAVGGHQVPPTLNFYDKFEMAHYAQEYRDLRIIEKIDYAGGLYSNNLSIPRHILEEVGLFNERFLTGADPELTRRISEAGYTLVHDPAIVVSHLKVHSWRSFHRMRFRRGCGSVLTDVQAGTLTFRRFLPFFNPRRTWLDWQNFRKMFGGNGRSLLQFWIAAVTSRLADVSGRIYFYWKIGRTYQPQIPKLEKKI